MKLRHTDLCCHRTARPSKLQEIASVPITSAISPRVAATEFRDAAISLRDHNSHAAHVYTVLYTYEKRDLMMGFRVVRGLWPPSMLYFCFKRQGHPFLRSQRICFEEYLAFFTLKLTKTLLGAVQLILGPQRRPPTSILLARRAMRKDFDFIAPVCICPIFRSGPFDISVHHCLLLLFLHFLCWT